MHFPLYAKSEKMRKRTTHEVEMVVPNGMFGIHYN